MPPPACSGGRGSCPALPPTGNVQASHHAAPLIGLSLLGRHHRRRHGVALSGCRVGGSWGCTARGAGAAQAVTSAREAGLCGVRHCSRDCAHHLPPPCSQTVRSRHPQPPPSLLAVGLPAIGSPRPPPGRGGAGTVGSVGVAIGPAHDFNLAGRCAACAACPRRGGGNGGRADARAARRVCWLPRRRTKKSKQKEQWCSYWRLGHRESATMQLVHSWQMLLWEAGRHTSCTA